MWETQIQIHGLVVILLSYRHPPPVLARNSVLDLRHTHDEKLFCQKIPNKLYKQMVCDRS